MKPPNRNVKNEGAKNNPDIIHDINDEDDLLYGGDQTPASMVSVSIHMF